MEGKHVTSCLFLFVLVFDLFVPIIVAAAESDVVITEIAAYAASDHEWIEIYNRGAESVDLTGWKFFEDGVNHSLSPARGDMIIEPGEYVVIADVAANVMADYPEFTGTVIDSAWTTLNEGGEAVALKNAGGVVVESFTYISAPDHALERVDSALADYSPQNWREHISAHTIGAVNSVMIAPTSSPESPAAPIENPAEAPAEIPPEPAPAPVPVPTVSTESSVAPALQIVTPLPVPVVLPEVWRPRRGDVLINELVSDPTDGEHEWVEIYNAIGRPVDLTGWSLVDGSGAVTSLRGALSSDGTGRFLLVPTPKGGLNNAGDYVALRDELKGVIDEVSYGTWDDGMVANNAPKANDPASLGRFPDGAHTFHNLTDFRVTATPTKGTSNVLTPEITAAISASHDSATKLLPTTDEVAAVSISELLPNPAGPESTDEFIELYNASGAPIDLTGWQLINGAGKKYTIKASAKLSSVIIPARGYLLLMRSVTGLSMKNTGGETIRLFPPGQTTPSTSITYLDKAPIGQSWTRGDGGVWEWSQSPTPGKENVIKRENLAPEVVIDVPSQIEVGQEFVVDAGDSDDPENDDLGYRWEFGDGVVATGAITTHHYESVGVFTVSVTVSDAGHTVTERRTVRALAPLAINSSLMAAATEYSEDGENSEISGNTTPKKKPANAQNITLPQEVDITAARQLPLGTAVRVTGVVSALPGQLGATIAYLAGSGIQIYNAKKLFPTLQLGDVVSVVGVLSETGGERRIKTKTASDIVVQNHGEVSLPHVVETGVVGEELEGTLVTVHGTVTEARWPSFQLDDGSGVVRVTVKESTQIPKQKLAKEERWTVTGVVGQTTSGYRILPRVGTDLVKQAVRDTVGATTAHEGEVVAVPTDGVQTDMVRHYLWMTLAALTVCGGGLMIQQYLGRKTPPPTV